MWVCRLPVHIGPAGCTGFTEIFGEFVTSHWADRVVGPYGEASMHTYPVGADDSVRPVPLSFRRGRRPAVERSGTNALGVRRSRFARFNIPSRRAGPVCPAGTNAVSCGGTHGSRPTGAYPPKKKQRGAP